MSIRAKLSFMLLIYKHKESGGHLRMSITTNILFQLKKATIKNLKGHQDANDKLI